MSETWGRFGGDINTLKYEGEEDLDAIADFVQSWNQNNKRRTFILLCTPENTRIIMAEVKLIQLLKFNFGRLF